MNKYLQLFTLLFFSIASHASVLNINSFDVFADQGCPIPAPGSFNFEVVGGTAPYYYNITDGLGATVLSGTSATGIEILSNPGILTGSSYILDITDDVGANVSTTAISTSSPPWSPAVSASITNDDCGNFEITVTPDLGFDPVAFASYGFMTYTSTPAPTTISGNVVTYSPMPNDAFYTIYEANIYGCAYPIVVTNPLSLTNIVNTINPSAFGLNNGKITVPISYIGISNNYTFTYTAKSSLTGATVITPILNGSNYEFVNLYAGTYTITQSFTPSSCVLTYIITIIDPPNLVTGNVKINFSGICGAFDPVAKVLINASNGSTSKSVISNASGTYLTGLSASTFTLTATPLINPSYYSVSPINPVIIFPPAISPETQNFCLTPVGVHHNLSISITPYGPNRPGFNTNYQIAVTNTGNQYDGGCFTFNFDNTKQTFASSSFPPSLLAANYVTYCPSGLAPMETKYFTIILSNNSPTALNDGDYTIVNALLTINTNVDEDLLNNTANSSRVVRNSYDPNNKVCAQGDTIFPSQVGNYLSYAINFENTGSAPAVNITVKDFIDLSQYDLSTLTPGLGSAPFTTTIIAPNEVNFTFTNINLPETPGSNTGYLTYSIKPLSTLVKGDSVQNNAQIYFDFNAPIITNYAVTKIDTFYCTPINAITTLSNTNSNFCQGDSFKINTTVDGLVNPTVGYTYKWYNYTLGTWLPESYTTPYLYDVAGAVGTYLLAIEVMANSGCRDTTFITLNIGKKYIDTITKYTCGGSYTWPVNNMTYNLSGYYTQNYNSVYGCDSIIVLALSLDPLPCPPAPTCKNSFVQAFEGLADTTNNGFETVSATNIFPAPDGLHFYVTGLKKDSIVISYFDENGTRIWTDMFKYDANPHQIKDLFIDQPSGDIIAIAVAGNQGSAFRYSTTLHSLIWANTYDKNGWNNYYNIHSLNATTAIIAGSKLGFIHSFTISKINGNPITSSSGGYALDGIGGEYNSILDNNILYGSCRRYNSGTDYRSALFAQNATTGAFLWGNSIISAGNMSGAVSTRMYPVAPIVDGDSLVVLSSGQLNGFGIFTTTIQDIVIAKTSKVGIETWTKKYFVTGNPANYTRPVAKAIKNTANGYYIVGNYYANTLGFKRRGFVIKTDKQGNTLWAKQLGIGNTRNEISNVAEMDGALFVTMSSNSYSSTSNDLLVIKLNINDYSDTVCNLIKFLPISITDIAPVNNSFTYTNSTNDNTLISKSASVINISIPNNVQCATCCPLQAQIRQTKVTQSYCPGELIIVNTIINGITNPAGAYTYNWFNTTTSWVPIGFTTPNVNTVASGANNYTLAVIIESINGFCKDTFYTSVIINAFKNPDTTTIAACNTYTWPINNITYTTSGFYTKVYKNVFGCDSNEVLNLTINNITRDTLNIAQCGTYLWTNGTTYTTSGFHSQNFTSIYGCDSIKYLNLTIGFTLSCNKDSINISTGIDAGGNSLPIFGFFTPGTQGAFWKDSTTGNFLYAQKSIASIWEITPVAVTNAQFMNQNGLTYSNFQSVLNGVPYSTFTRDFNITKKNGNIIPTFSVAADDSIISIQLISPTGIVYPLVKPISSYILKPVISPTTIPSEIGTWKIKVRVWFYDEINGFLLSGNIITSASCDSICCPSTITELQNHSNKNYCINDSVSIKALVNGINNPLGYTYQWYYSTLFSPTYISFGSANGANTNTYSIVHSSAYAELFMHLVVKNPNGICSDTLNTSYTVFQPFKDTVKEFACDSFIINGNTIKNSGYFVTNITTTSFGTCDTTRIIDLTIFKAKKDTITIINCLGTVWGLTLITEPGFYPLSFLGSNGCDSISYLNYIKGTLVCKTDSINISTGINATGSPLAVANIFSAGAQGNFWKDSALGTFLYAQTSYVPFWEPTPVSITNAQFMNHNGKTSANPINVLNGTPFSTFTRDFNIVANSGNLTPAIRVASDDSLISLELISPSGIIYPLIRPIGSYFLGTVTSPVAIPSEVGTWQVKARVWFYDATNGFLLSGYIINPPICDTICCPTSITLAKNFTNSTYCQANTLQITSNINGQATNPSYNYQWYGNLANTSGAWVSYGATYNGNTPIITIPISGVAVSTYTIALVTTTLNGKCNDTSIVETVNVINGIYDTLVVNECNRYLWNNGIAYTTSGTYTQTFKSVNNCDSISVLKLTINTALCSPCADCGIDSIALSTGIDNNNLVQVAGANELHWKLASAPALVTAGILPTVINDYAPPAGAKYISPGGFIDGDYVYERQFEICSSGNFKLNFISYADNSDSIFVDGNYVSNTINTPFGFTTGNQASAVNYVMLLNAGMHNITAKVNNDGGNTGFYFNGTIKPADSLSGKLSTDTNCCTYNSIVMTYTSPIIINGITYNAIGKDKQIFTNAAGCDSTLEIVLSPAASPFNTYQLLLKGEQQISKNVLTWITQYKEHTNNYILSKSIDGKEFKTISTIEQNSISNNVSTNTFIDKELTTAISYYKLTQVLKNGNIITSNIIQLQNANNFLNNLLVYPNPTTNKVNVQINNAKNGKTVMHVFNSLGAKIMEQPIELVKGIQTFELDLINLPVGNYMLQVLIDNNLQMIKVLKK